MNNQIQEHVSNGIALSTASEPIIAKSTSTNQKIGIIGDGSVGKTALMIALANIDKNNFSTVDIDRSTFNYLQFDTHTYRHPQSNKIVPITFIDIQGATDVKDSESIGSYIELISIADCDLYLIAFDKPFSKHNRHCQEHIENTLRRKYILVRTKTDMLFSEFAKKKSNNEHRNDSINYYDSKIALSDTRQNASISSDRERLSDEIYLTAAGYDDMLKNSPFFTFDLEKLKKKLVRLAIKDTRVERTWNSKDKSVTSQNTKACIGHVAYTIVGRPATILGAIGKVLDSTIQIAVPASAAALRAASIAGIVIGVVLTPAFALWSFYSTGKRMDEHLHILCDDLHVIAAYFLAAIYNSHINITRLPEIVSFDTALSGADESSSDEE
ncbi:unnamed protein product [Rotaria sordida]|uniref:G domain-containing protein n=1 Tax=Rotaria sordida TaxID=392033 RepID=A0A819S1Y6_9BILA|nr:unnamed protein product [Rotaria sordida]